jgi:PPE-repeat protein
MLAAASTWDGLAAELRSAAVGYQSVVSRLSNEGWMGPSSASMAAAAAPYVTWMSTTAGQAEQTAAQAKTAAAAYEAAFAMTVPPPVIAANRAQLAALVATNFLGQNTPAIAATEAHYGAMWAQDAAAMYSYAGSSAAASKVTPFAAPQQTTNPAGLAGQSGAVAQATGTSAATNTQSALSQFTSTMPTALQSLASPGAATGSGSGLSDILDPLGLQNSDLLNAMSNLMSSTFSPMSLAGITQIGADLAAIHAAAAGSELGLDAPASLMPLVPGVEIGAFGPAGAAGLGGAQAVSATMSRATQIGALSVPQSWTAATPVANSAATLVSDTRWTGALPDAAPGGAPGMPGMPVAGSGGRGFGFATPRYGFKPTVMARPVVAG